MTHTIYGERYNKYEPIIDAKSGEVIDDGSPKKIRLATWKNRDIADSMATNIKNHVQKRPWKIWVE